MTQDLDYDLTVKDSFWDHIDPQGTVCMQEES